MTNRSKSNWKEKRSCPICGRKWTMVKLINISSVKGDEGYLSTLECKSCGHRWQVWQQPRIPAEGHSYISVPNRGSVVEHIWVWEQHHGKLPKGHLIHHINGVKHDNRIENLLLLPRQNRHPRLVSQAMKQRIQELEKEVRRLRSAGLS